MFTSSQYELFLASNFAISFSLSSNGSIGVFVSDCVKWDKHLSWFSFFLKKKNFTEEGREAPHPPASYWLVQCQRVTRGPAAWPRNRWATWTAPVAMTVLSAATLATWVLIPSPPFHWHCSFTLGRITQTADAYRQAQWAVTAYWTHRLKCGRILKRHF